jgi:hypothetical protein
VGRRTAGLVTAAPATQFSVLGEIAAMAAGPDRDKAAVDWIHEQLALCPNDQVTRQRLRNEVARLKVVPLKMFDAVAGRVSRVAAVFDEDPDRPGRPAPPEGMLPVPGSPGWGYRPASGEFAGDVWQSGREGYSEVLGWAPSVPRFLETPSPDGSGATAYYFEIRAGGRTVVASGDELALGEPWKLLPVTGTGAKRVREVLANIVLAEAAKGPIGRALARTGWHRDNDGDRYYVFADGRTSDGREVVLVGKRHRDRLAAAARTVQLPDTGEIAAAIFAVAEHGRGPGLAGLGIGVRALGQSLHRVPGGFIAIGEPNAGKSSLGWHARLVMVARADRADAWPPLPSATFLDTKTIIESAMDYEADMPTLIDDAAITDKSSRAEVGDVVAKLEMVFRALANDAAQRGRMDRTMLPRDPNYVRSPVIATMQGSVADIPVQNSLLRRVVLLPVRRGDIDIAWYREAGNASGLVTPIRALGEHLVITYLSVLGDKAPAYIAAMDAEARKMLAAALEEIMPGWEDNAEGLAGVADIAACALSGLLIACAVCNLSAGIVQHEALPYLVSAIAAQAARMGDSAEAASPGEALGEILRAALLDQRAHVRDHQGEAAPAIPGLADQEQGLEAVGDRSGLTVYRGRGVPLYWLPDVPAIGVRAESLHKLIRASADTRVPAKTPRSLPGYLVAERLAIASDQKDGTGTHQKKIAGTKQRLVYLTADTLAEAAENGDRVTGTTGTTGTAQVNAANSNGTDGTGVTLTGTSQVRDGFAAAPVPPPVAADPSNYAPDVRGTASPGAVPVATSEVPVPVRETCAKCGGSLGRWLIDRGATHHVCCYADGDPEFARVFGGEPSAASAVALALGDERTTVVPAAPVAEAPEVTHRRWVVLGLGDRAYAAGGEVLTLADGTLAGITNAGELAAVALALGAERLYIPREVREALGLPEALGDTDGPRQGVPHIFTESTDPGQWDIWPAEPVGLAGWMAIYRMPSALHQGAAVVFPEWLRNTPALAELAPVDLARALELIHLATTHGGNGSGGVEFYRSPASTFARHLDKAARYSRKGSREAIELPPPYDRTAKHPRNAPTALKPPGSHPVAVAELHEGDVIARLDVRSCFASAAESTDFGIGEAEHVKGGELTKHPGARLVRVPAGATAHPSLLPFAPAASGKARDVLAWMDTHAALWLAECGIPVELIESWIWPTKHRVFESALGRLGEARTRLEADGSVPALAAAAVVKAMPNTFLGGWLASDFNGARRDDDWTARWDWWLSIRVQAEVRKQRNLLPSLLAGPVQVLGEQQVDSVYVAAPTIADILAMPGTGGNPAIADKRGKFKLEAHATVTHDLAAILADRKGTGHARLAAIRATLAEGE